MLEFKLEQCLEELEIGINSYKKTMQERDMSKAVKEYFKGRIDESRETIIKLRKFLNENKSN